MNDVLLPNVSGDAGMDIASGEKRDGYGGRTAHIRLCLRSLADDGRDGLLRSF
jgi:hypothetical protein